MVDYELVRPNEIKLTFYLEECNTDWKAVALNLLAWLSDDEVREWAEYNGFDIFEEEQIMKNITSFYIGEANSSGIICESKEEFLQYLSEKIDRIDEEGEFNHFDIMIEPNSY